MKDQLIIEDWRNLLSFQQLVEIIMEVLKRYWFETVALPEN